MNETATVEAARDFYSPVLDAEMSGLEKFSPQDFNPCAGTILVVLPPKVMKIGSIHLVEARDQSAGTVAAVPEDDWDGESGSDRCPVRPGDWVIFRVGAGSPVMFGGRKDLILLNYVDGPESDILGFIRGLGEGVPPPPPNLPGSLGAGLTSD